MYSIQLVWNGICLESLWNWAVQDGARASARIAIQMIICIFETIAHKIADYKISDVFTASL